MKKDEAPAKGGKVAAAKDHDADAVEGEPSSRDAKKKDTPRGRPLASAERQGLGRPDVLPVPGGGAAVTKEGAFLRRLHRGACGIFSTVLGPEAERGAPQPLPLRPRPPPPQRVLRVGGARSPTHQTVACLAAVPAWKRADAQATTARRWCPAATPISHAVRARVKGRMIRSCA